MNETPLPLTVWAMITLGRPFTAFAASQAATIAATSWPSHSITFQPKARHLSGMGSTGMIAAVSPMSWTWLSSTIASSESSPNLAPVRAASQTWPSCSSPSPRST